MLNLVSRPPPSRGPRLSSRLVLNSLVKQAIVYSKITNFWLDSLPGKDYGLLRHRGETIDCLKIFRVTVTRGDRHCTEVAYLASSRSTGVETSGPVRVSRLAMISPIMEC